jgi:hypothetical protein
MRLYLAGLLSLAACASAPDQAAEVRQRPLSVILEIALDGQGKPTAVTVAKIIDPAFGSTDAVDVAVPDSILANLREKYMNQTYEAGRDSVFTYEFFSPAMR